MIIASFVIVATLVYLLTPARRDTMQRFRLDFKGAAEGRFPNGTAFNISDIVSGPIVLRAYNANGLAAYAGFGDFSRSVFVLESNDEYQKLAAEYQARLADPKLSAVDRERIEKEFDLRRQSIAKSEYAIHFTRRAGMRDIPEAIARKVLLDVLNDWADFVVNQQRATSYRVSVLSAEILKPSDIERQNVVAALQALRSRANRIIANIDVLKELPSANLVRTKNDRISLDEVRIRLEEIVRFRLEPLLPLIRSNGMVDGATTLRFLESELAYDQRQLDAAVARVEATRSAMAAYERPEIGSPEPAEGPASERRTAATSGPVAAQLSESFLDRLIQITERSSDVAYRQQLVEDYRTAVAATIPLGQAVAYDRQVVEEFRRGPAANIRSVTAEAVRQEIEQARAEIGVLIGKVNELFMIINRNMTPSAQLFTLTAPASTATLRSISAQRLFLYGVFVTLASFPLIILGCLLHHRLVEDEAAPESALGKGRRAVST